MSEISDQSFESIGTQVDAVFEALAESRNETIRDLIPKIIERAQLIDPPDMADSVSSQTLPTSTRVSIKNSEGRRDYFLEQDISSGETYYDLTVSDLVLVDPATEVYEVVDGDMYSFAWDHDNGIDTETEGLAGNELKDFAAIVKLNEALEDMLNFMLLGPDESAAHPSHPHISVNFLVRY